jgi:hypothetical protein
MNGFLVVNDLRLRGVHDLKLFFFRHSAP